MGTDKFKILFFISFVFFYFLIEIFPDSLNILVFPKYNETITWNKCKMCIHNVLSSERWIDHYGDVLVESSTGTKARISFMQVEKNRTITKNKTQTIFRVIIKHVRTISLAILLISMVKLYIKYSVIGMKRSSSARIKQRNVFGDKVEFSMRKFV